MVNEQDHKIAVVASKPAPQAERDTDAAPAPELDIVEEAGKESFPASDAPPWTP